MFGTNGDSSNGDGGAHPVLGVLYAADAVFEDGRAEEAGGLGDDDLAGALARANALAAKQAELLLRLLGLHSGVQRR